MILSFNWSYFLLDYVEFYFLFLGNGDKSWCFSQIKGALDDDVTDADIISCVEFNHDGELLATGDKGGRVVIFQVSFFNDNILFNHSHTYDRRVYAPKADNYIADNFI